MTTLTPQDDVQVRTSDQFENETGSDANPSPESRSSESDAGLDDGAWTEPDAELDADFDEAGEPREIPMTDVEDLLPVSRVHSFELSDLSSPGDVDIEDLDESDLDDTDLPADARLDPLEP